MQNRDEENGKPINKPEWIKMNLSRRSLLKHGLGATALLGTLGLSGLAAASAVGGKAKPVRFGIIGAGGRGTQLMNILLEFPGVEIRAICDLVQSKIDNASLIVEKKTGIKPVGYCGDELYYRKMLQRDDFDAVLIATSIKWHGPMSIDAMKAGKHVGSEVPACRTLEECRQLVEMKEKHNVHYFMMENYLFRRLDLAVLNAVQKGVLGAPYYAECGYIHEYKAGQYEPDGSLNWRGEVMNYDYGIHYPTHSGGSVFKWMGINEGDRLVRLTCYATKPNRTAPEYYAHRFGKERAAKLPFRLGEMTTCLMTTAHGRVIKMDLDIQSNRPHSFYYLLQGTKGIYDNRFGISLLDRYPDGPEHLDLKWQDADKYLEPYDHPLWKKFGAQANTAGHGGGDYFVVRELYQMVRDNREPWIDVYDSAHWSSIYECTQRSLDQQNATITIPDFTRGRWEKTDWRKGRLTI